MMRFGGFVDEVAERGAVFFAHFAAFGADEKQAWRVRLYVRAACIGVQAVQLVD